MNATGIPLSGLSLLFYRLHEELDGELTTEVFVRVRGRIEPEQFRRAAQLLGQLHPQLTAAIVPGRRNAVLTNSESPRSIPCDFRDRRDAHEWKSRMHELCDQPFNTKNGPLIRFEVLIDHAADESDILFGGCHATLDGMSYVQLLRDLLELYEASPERVIVPVPRVQPTGCVKRGLRSLALLRSIGQTCWRRLPNFWTPAAKIAMREPQQLPFEHCVLDEDFSQRLIQRARFEETTVMGVLLAAMLHTLAKDVARQGERLTVLIPLSIRSWFKPEIDDRTIGLFTSFLVQEFRNVAKSPFWDLAQECRESIKSHLANNGPVGVQRMIRWLAPWVGLQHRPPRQHCMFNNLGSISEVRSPSGLLTATEFTWRFKARSRPYPMIVCVATIAGRINLSFVSGMHSAEELGLCLKTYFARLRSAIEEPGRGFDGETYFSFATSAQPNTVIGTEATRPIAAEQASSN